MYHGQFWYVCHFLWPRLWYFLKEFLSIYFYYIYAKGEFNSILIFFQLLIQNISMANILQKGGKSCLNAATWNASNLVKNCPIFKIFVSAESLWKVFIVGSGKVRIFSPKVRFESGIRFLKKTGFSFNPSLNRFCNICIWW